MKLLVFGAIFAIFAVFFYAILPGIFKVLALAPLSAAVVSVFIYTCMTNQQKEDQRDAERRRRAVAAAAKEIGLKKIPKNIDELMEMAKSVGKEAQAFEAYEKSLR